MNILFSIMKKKYLFWAFLIPCLWIFSSCEKEPGYIKDCEEFITNLNFTLTPTSGDVVTLSFSDPDGDGSIHPTVTDGTLQENMTYVGSLELLDQSNPNDVENYSEEITEEDIYHQFFFEVNDLDLNIDYNDIDANGNPVGLATIITTGEASTGTITVTLRHEPDKNATGVADGDITNAGGETDVEIEFNLWIE